MLDIDYRAEKNFLLKHLWRKQRRSYLLDAGEQKAKVPCITIYRSQ